MKPDRISLFSVLNIVVLLSCIVLGYKSFADAKKYAGEGNIYISPVFNDNTYYFSVDEIKRLEDFYPNTRFSYEKFSCEYAANGAYEKYTKVVYTNSRYFGLNNFDFKEGSPWADSYDRKRVAVVTESLGWYLFGSLDICGKFIAIDGDMYQISGIIAQNDIIEDGFYAWVPYESADNKGTDISNLYVKNNIYNPVDSFSTVKNCLDDLNKNTIDYKITDLNQYRNNIGLKYQLILLLLFSASVVYLFFRVYYVAAENRNIKEKAVFIICYSVIILIVFGVILGLKGNIEDNLWITAEPFSIQSAVKILWNTDGLPGKEYMPYHLNELYKINRNSNLFMVGALLSIVNLFFTKKHTKFKNNE